MAVHRAIQAPHERFDRVEVNVSVQKAESQKREEREVHPLIEPLWKHDREGLTGYGGFGNISVHMYRIRNSCAFAAISLPFCLAGALSCPVSVVGF
jgi:hypothetical protein